LLEYLPKIGRLNSGVESLPPHIASLHVGIARPARVSSGELAIRPAAIAV
jgi:hypothetical protein